MTSGRRGTALCLLLVTALLSLPCFCAVSSAADPVKIGYCLSLTGVYATLGEDLRDGLELYMDQIGHKAGGRNIEVVSENIGSAVVTLTQEAAHKLIEQDKVDIIAGVVDSRVAYSVASQITGREIPFVISNAGADDLTQRRASPLIVRVSFSSSSGSHPLGVWAYEQGFRKAVAMGAANPAGYEQVGGICRTFTKLGGKIVQELWPPLGTQDYKPFFAQLDRDADVVMVFFAGGDALRFVQQYAESGLKGKIALIGKGDLVSEQLLTQQGQAADGIVSVLHWCSLLDTPENAQFKAAYTKKFGRAPSQFSEQGYVTGMVIAEALNKTGGQVRGREFVKTMRSLELKAPRGTIKFDEYGAPVQNYYIRQVQMIDGQRQNAIVKVYPAVSQFWIWSPAEFMAMPPYTEMKGEWANK
ncbi:MAG: ABC transporter substrate-binding protein [Desulfomonile tiedjei]|uniref:ABC transporter substrate-binding protein n=1 Tax=Desulfomonile tiedjei TaxID=2358 RepID=A0A9D6V3V4_9BACT|nr:ABC transporter substrate-binding protein [Desulfomonile tiedjei]